MHFDRLWIMFRKAHFGQADVLRLVPIDAMTLQNWSNRQIVVPDKMTPGQRGRRLYSGHQVLTLAFMSHFVSMGESPMAANISATQVDIALTRAKIEHAPRDERGNAHIRYVDLREYCVILGPFHERDRTTVVEWSDLHDALRTRDAATVINAGKIVQDLVLAARTLKPMKELVPPDEVITFEGDTL